MSVQTTKPARELRRGDVLVGLGRINEVGATAGLGLVKCRDAEGNWLVLFEPSYEVAVES